MKCANCEFELANGEAFCTNCGEKTELTEAGTKMMDAPPPPDEGPEAETKMLEATEEPEDELFVEVREALKADYEVTGELGRGGMAIVYDGTERELHRRVALKVLPPEMASSSTAERFKREARLAASLDHQNIIPVYRVGNTAGIHYMAMKYVDGRALDEIVKGQGALTIPIIVRVLTDAARGLAYAHDKKIVHRDIKGGNILIDTDGRVMVADFGIARALGDQTITATGMVVGTPSFMSPEQCSGSKIGPHADQYSLGVLAFQLLTGELPFQGDSFIAVVQHHYMTPPPDIRQARKDVPKALLDVVYRALAKKPEGRFATTHDMVRALEAVPISADDKHQADQQLRGLSKGQRFSEIKTAKLPPPTPPTPMPGATGMVAQQPEAKKRSGVAVAAALLIVIGGGGGVTAWQMGVFGGSEPTLPAQTPVPARPTMVILTFLDLPPGATVAVDGATLPGNSGPVSPGLKTYVVTAPNYQRLQGTVTVDSDMQLSIGSRMQPIRRTPTTAQRPRPAAAQMGDILVAVRGVSGASATIDGNPIVVNELTQAPVGQRRLQVSAPGYITLDTIVTIAAAGRTSIPVRLRSRN